MNTYNRGSKVIIETVFYDTSGDIAQPTSARIVIAYPSGSTSDDWPFDGNDLLTSTSSLANTSTTAGTWATTWNSAVSAPGVVAWTAVPSNTLYGVNEGRFLLRGGLANSAAVPTTL